MKKVSYEYARKYMKTGDPIFWYSRSLLGAIIRIKSKNWNHVSIVMCLPDYEGTEQRRWVAESIKGGPHLTLLSYKLKTHDGIVGWAPLKGFTDEQRKAIGENAMKLMGVADYDYPELVKQICGSGEVGGNVICSEYWQFALGMEGKVLSPEGIAKLPFLHEMMEVSI